MQILPFGPRIYFQNWKRGRNIIIYETNLINFSGKCSHFTIIIENPRTKSQTLYAYFEQKKIGPCVSLYALISRVGFCSSGLRRSYNYRPPPPAYDIFYVLNQF